MRKRIISLLLAVCMLAAVTCTASADAVYSDVKGYVVLGENLSDDQKSTVLQLMGVDDLSQYNVSYTTHQEEVDTFGSYLDASVLGTKALSSILLVPADEGSGINITLYNISYCTVEMYQSALIDAGVSDVNVIVAGPTSLSGTCALVSAMKAYSIMSGEEISSAAQDAAVNEIVTTGDVADEIGDTDNATEIIAALKQTVVEEDLSEEQIGTALDKLCEEYGVSLSDETRQEIIDLMMKIKNCDIDVDALKQQAGDLYNRIKEQVAGLTGEQINSDLGGFFGSIINTILDFFKGLFG